MRDLNDIFYFSEVVAHGGFAAAGRALKLPKSKLSRRIAQLERRLGARLIERSSRRFRVTEVGQAYYEHCRAALAEVERGDALVAEAQAEPRGMVRFACPTGLVELVGAAMSDFLKQYPRITLRIVATDRVVDLIAERIDVAMRVRVRLETDAALTVRTLGHSRRILVASPALAGTIAEPADIGALARIPTLSSDDGPAPVTWVFETSDGRRRQIIHEPRIACADFGALRTAAQAGLGVALMPDHTCADGLRSGTLVRVFPDWHAEPGIVHLVFTTRTGLPPQVRAWIDHLADHVRRNAIFAGP